MPPLPHIFADPKLESVIVDLTAKLLQSVVDGDWDTYVSLVSQDMTAFEPEGGEHQIQGLDFHKFYFQLATAQAHTSPPPYTPHIPAPSTSIVSPRVRILCPDRSSALISYVRVVQKVRAEPSGALTPIVTSSQETRVWEHDRKEGWKCVHFHRSLVQKDVVKVVKEVPAKAKL
ncbi:Calcium/calmodulin dependent protein kinase II association-domain-containing protein [Phlyctochytrium arcticum]|nr:Calcium/calmodulin dependent protein kinase II association-domain-containing protein [Phlyctochytrium arcticum]